ELDGRRRQPERAAPARLHQERAPARNGNRRGRLSGQGWNPQGRGTGSHVCRRSQAVSERVGGRHSEVNEQARALPLKPEVTVTLVTNVVVAACAIVMIVSAPQTVSAQWLKYPTAGVPRASDGRPDLNAPAPRTPDGKPDLSGIWDIEHNRP